MSVKVSGKLFTMKFHILLYDWQHNRVLLLLLLFWVSFTPALCYDIAMARMSLDNRIFQLYYNIIGALSYMWSIIN